MSKRKPSDAKPGRGEPDIARSVAGRKSARGQGAAPPAGKKTPSSSWIPSPAALRETVESIVVAFVLAFLFRTFEAEAFVIPTGSMAPTLMGRHKDYRCPVCGYEYQVGAPDRQSDGAPADVESGTCPICRTPADLRPGNSRGEDYPTFNGDRILVAKFPYEFAEPKRWDVIVFKFPGDATTNYIKRLVGLPGETVWIHHGDLWIRNQHGTLEIARKPPSKLLAMLQPVFDNDAAPKIAALGWPARWQALPQRDRAGQWESADDGTAFHTDGSGEGETWLRYCHRVPSCAQWEEMLRRHALPRGETFQPQLISDFTAYDTAIEPTITPDRKQPTIAPDCKQLGCHWVGDLAMECALDVQSDSGEVVFELVKGGRRFQCRIDVATGTATLNLPGGPKAETAVCGPGQHKVMFSNVDDELLLWVDGSVATFDAETTYDSFAMRARIPTTADLLPAGIATRFAAVKVGHLKLSRDIYYIAVGSKPAEQSLGMNDFKGFLPVLADPATWAAAFGNENMRRVYFELAAPDPRHPEQDQFFVLGDNSASSKDGRLWAGDGIESYVSRRLLIGKALFIYWPHSWGELPGPLAPLPCFPNFKRMHLVR
jgi:signal peptidase I